MTKTRSHRIARAGVALFLAAVVFELLWLAAMNPFLGSAKLAALINKKPEKLRIEWQSARSWWPGHLRVEGLKIRANQVDAQWVFEADTANAQISLAGLLRKTFRARNVTAYGGAFRFRKLPRTPFAMEKEPIIAPIPWSPYELRPADEDPAAIVAAEVRPPVKRIWAVDLQGASVEGIREIWINEHRYLGTAHAEGDLFLLPKERLDLPRATVTLGEGTVTQGERKVIVIREGYVELAMPDVDMVEHRGRELVDLVDARITLESTLENIRFFDLYLGRFPGLELHSGPGTLSMNVEVVKGVVAGNLDLAGKGVKASYEGRNFLTDLRIDGRIVSWPLTGGVIDIAGTHGRLENVKIEDENDDRMHARGGEHWFGKATLLRGKVTLGEAFVLDAKISADLRDSGPLVAMFEARRNLPDKVQKALHVTGLKAETEITVGGGKADVRRFEVTGDDFELSARAKMQEGKDTRAILYVKRGKLSIGLEKGADRNVKVVHPRRWFDAHALAPPPER